MKPVDFRQKVCLLQQLTSCGLLVDASLPSNETIRCTASRDWKATTRTMQPQFSGLPSLPQLVFKTSMDSSVQQALSIMPSPAPSTPHAQFHESNIYRHGQTFDLSIRSRAPQHVAPASNHATPCDVEISSSGDARMPSFTEQKWKLNKVRHRHDPTMQRAQSPSYRRSRAPSPEMMRTKRTHNQAFPQPLAQHDLDIEKNPHPPYTRE